MNLKTLSKANEVSHQIKMLNEELATLRSSFRGNRWWIGFGQDKAHCSEVTTTSAEFNEVIHILIKFKETRLAELETEFEKL